MTKLYNNAVYVFKCCYSLMMAKDNSRKM